MLPAPLVSRDQRVQTVLLAPLVAEPRVRLVPQAQAAQMAPLEQRGLLVLLASEKPGPRELLALLVQVE